MRSRALRHTRNTDVDVGGGGGGVKLPGWEDDESVGDDGGGECVGETKEIYGVEREEMK